MYHNYLLILGTKYFYCTFILNSILLLLCGATFLLQYKSLPQNKTAHTEHFQETKYKQKCTKTFTQNENNRALLSLLLMSVTSMDSCVDVGQRLWSTEVTWGQQKYFSAFMHLSFCSLWCFMRLIKLVLLFCCTDKSFMLSYAHTTCSCLTSLALNLKHLKTTDKDPFSDQALKSAPDISLSFWPSAFCSCCSSTLNCSCRVYQGHDLKSEAVTSWPPPSGSLWLQEALDFICSGVFCEQSSILSLNIAVNEMEATKNHDPD